MQVWRRPSFRHLFDGGLMLLYRLSSSAVGLIIYAVGMRAYGPDLMGKYAYAVTAAQLLAPLLIGGLDPMLVRELVRRPNERLDLLGSAFALVLISTLAAVGIPLLYVVATSPDDHDLILMVSAQSVGLLPTCLFVLMSFFRAESRIKLVTVCGLAGVIVCALVRVVMVLHHDPLWWVSAANMLDPVVCGAMLVAAYQLHFGSLLAWRVSRASVRTLFELTWPAVLSGFMSVLFFRISHFMLKSLSTYEELGYYAVAFQMFSVLNFVPNSVLAVIYPKLVKLHQVDPPRYLDMVRRIYVVVTLSGMLICIGVYLWVTPIITLVFGAQSTPAGVVAMMMAVANLFTFSGSVRYQVIYIEHKPVYHVYNTLLGFVVLIPLNLFLIPRFGAVGAAAGVACACFASAVASSWVFAPLRSTGVDQALAFVGMRRRLQVA
jgi:PST family polysaccharide transporter